LESINNSRYKTIDLPMYKGDNSLRQASIDYIKLVYSVFNEDYAKIVNMEEIAEQSFDEMQAMILLQEKTDEKLAEAATKRQAAATAFAAKYNVKVIESDDDLGQKLKETSDMNEYRNKIYLIFFKCNWQDNELVKAMIANKLTLVEQARTSLIRYADEGLATLATLKAFKGDNTLASACKQALTYYKKMAETEIPKQTDFFLKKENFEKLQKAMDKKTERTKEDVNTFNAAVNDINKASEAFNFTNKKINDSRNEAVNNWNEAQKTFADNNTPYYKK